MLTGQMLRTILMAVVLLLSCGACGHASAQEAPGAPGLEAHWPGAAKDGFGTSNTLASKVWFTLSHGVLTEVFYPTLDVPNVQTLQFIIVTPEGKVETESEDTTHSITVVQTDSLSFRQENRAKSGAYVLYKEYVADPERNSIVMRVLFESKVHEPTSFTIYVYYDPSLNNSGKHDSAWSEGDALLAVDGDKASALIAQPALAETTNGFAGTSDGLKELRTTKTLGKLYPRAANGNVIQVGRLTPTKIIIDNGVSFTLALGFGKTAHQARDEAKASLAIGFNWIRAQYDLGWNRYVETLPSVGKKYQPQLNMAAMVLKALEDKTYRGAMIASPSSPWGGGANADEPTTSGYHAVWSRDLYHVATAFLALGDRASANRALDYLFKVQQKPDGSFPQNSWVDGRPIGNGLQMDQVGLPLVLAYQLQRTDRQTWLKHIKPAADFILSKGPATDQDRWEEKRGYSPATMAAQIAGLVCAAHIASINKDKLSSDGYLKRADDWVQQLENWTATTNGPHAKSSYYLRITEDPDPNDGDKIEINSGGGVYDEREIVDGGFLELVRLGIKPADDPLIVRTLNVLDQLIKAETPGGSGWYRYNHDAYGERADGGKYDGRKGVGRLWALLTGERGEYEVARGQLDLARTRLDSMMAFANDGLMIPEQVWDRKDSPRQDLRFGEGTGAATPLAWSMAQFIRLAVNIQRGNNIETPRVVADRYLKRSLSINGRSH